MSFGTVAISLLAAAAVFWSVRQGVSPAPVALVGLILLAWLPVPPALQLWTGRLGLLVWATIGVALAATWRSRVTFPRNPRLAAGLLAFAIGLFAWWQVAPQVPGGDEPHYLIITQSLLKDGDLRIENNHRQGDYRDYYRGDLPPDFRVRGRNTEIYSIHAPGVSALIAPAFLIGGYTGTVLLLLALAAAGSALAWHLAWMVTKREDAAWFGWAAVTLSSTWIFHSFTIYPDGPAGVLVLTGVWALLRLDVEKVEGRGSVRPWFWHGVALALLPWLHTRFAVLAGGIGALVLLRLARVPRAPAKAFAFLTIPAVGFLAWLAYFVAIYGTPDPAAPYGSEEGSFRFVPDGLGGLFFDQRFGLIAYAPVLVIAFAGVGVMLGRRAWRRHAAELLFVFVPYLVVVTYVAMWWGGRSAPARFFAPVLPWMAIPAAAAWSVMTLRVTRVTALGALGFTAFASGVLVMASDGALAFNTRETYAAWLEWLNGSIDLARALPVWWRDTELPLFRGILVWSAAACAAWISLRVVETRGLLKRLPASVLVVACVFAAAASVATSITWAAEGVRGDLTTPSQLAALRTLSDERRVIALRLWPPRRMERDEVAGVLRIVPERSNAPGGAGRLDRPLYSVAGVPAGDYRMRVIADGSDGWLMIGIGRDQFAIQTTTLREAVSGLTVRFPVDVRALIVRGDEDARRNVRAIEISPERVVLPERQITSGYARHAVRYERNIVFFLDDESYPEPEAFWVRGEATAEIVIQPDPPAASVSLLLRNGAAANTVVVVTPRGQEQMELAAGEERRIQVPVDPAVGAAPVRITASAGFTPSAVDPKSRDHRFLGVWGRID